MQMLPVVLSSSISELACAASIMTRHRSLAFLAAVRGSDTAIWPTRAPSITTGDILAGLEDLRRLVAGRSRLGINLDLLFDKVDDPVDRDAAGGVDAGHRLLVDGEAGIRDLDDERNVSGRHVAFVVILVSTPHDGQIWFRLAPVRSNDRVFLAYVPTCRNER